MQQRVPLPWLRVYDELRRVAKSRRRMQLSEVREVAAGQGLPHTGFTLDQELSVLLSFFHSLNAVLWYDLNL
jgi:hypothetical protein